MSLGTETEAQSRLSQSVSSVKGLRVMISGLTQAPQPLCLLVVPPP